MQHRRAQSRGLKRVPNNSRRAEKQMESQGVVALTIEEMWQGHTAARMSHRQVLPDDRRGQ